MSEVRHCDAPSLHLAIAATASTFTLQNKRDREPLLRRINTSAEIKIWKKFRIQEPDAMLL